MLSDRRCLHLAIIDIAFASGFRDVSHFQSRVPPSLRRDAVRRSGCSDRAGAEVILRRSSNEAAP